MGAIEFVATSLFLTDVNYDIKLLVVTVQLLHG